jgi:hypothetical protein
MQVMHKAKNLFSAYRTTIFLHIKPPLEAVVLNSLLLTALAGFYAQQCIGRAETGQTRYQGNYAEICPCCLRPYECQGKYAKTCCDPYNPFNATSILCHLFSPPLFFALMVC